MNERYLTTFRNLNYFTKIDNYFRSFIEHLILKKSNNFSKLSIRKKVEVFENFLMKIFSDDKKRLYFCSLIFSQNNTFIKTFRLKFLLIYLIKNRFIVTCKETFLRIMISFFKIIF